MSGRIAVEALIASSAPAPDREPEPASSRLKSRIYSRLMLEEAAEGPLLGLAETKADGRGLCVFEELVRIAPVGETLQSRNYCRICHARVAGERIENAPIYWPHCPYVLLQNR
jgi:hypothetical protein